jgi:D-sedoheptulose 7-phosphate isomerase
MESTITALLDQSANLKQKVRNDAALVAAISASAGILASCAKAGGTIYACGNGGSACDAMHLCEELVARYKRNRAGIKALHFLDPGTLTCWGNDFSFEEAFGRYAETFCTDKDALVAISTSGNSENVLHAVRAAKAKGTKVIALTGKDGGELRTLADAALVIPSTETERIQEVHITIIHIWCELLETEYGFA